MAAQAPITERMQEATLGDPAAFLHDFWHDGGLAGEATGADEAGSSQ